jgi:hypothetical protein
MLNLNRIYSQLTAWWIEVSADTQELMDVEDVDVLGVVSSTLAYLASEVKRIANLACYALINVPLLGPSWFVQIEN